MAGAGDIPPAPAMLSFVQETAGGLSETLASSPLLALAVLFLLSLTLNLVPFWWGLP